MIRKKLDPAVVPIVIAAVILVGAVVWLVSRPLPDSPRPTRTSSSPVSIYTDTTGCQYLLGSGGGITPRLDNNRQPICTGRP